uniref:Uncharacterized protein n=1 Tax=Rhizophora mucronata TaxID=61149 RepID=A0A2P2II35_RHIMU
MLVELEQTVLQSFKKVFVTTPTPSKHTATGLPTAISRGKAKVQEAVTFQELPPLAQILPLLSLLDVLILQVQALQGQTPQPQQGPLQAPLLAQQHLQLRPHHLQCLAQGWGPREVALGFTAMAGLPSHLKALTCSLLL